MNVDNVVFSVRNYNLTTMPEKEETQINEAPALPKYR